MPAVRGRNSADRLLAAPEVAVAEPVLRDVEAGDDAGLHLAVVDGADFHSGPGEATLHDARVGMGLGGAGEFLRTFDGRFEDLEGALACMDPLFVDHDP